MTLQQAFDTFMQKHFEVAVVSSTIASWNGSGYSVELCNDGGYRVLWNDAIGNLYKSKGVILCVPSLTDEEWDDDPDIRYFENARKEMINKFNAYMLELHKYQLEELFESL